MKRACICLLLCVIFAFCTTAYASPVIALGANEESPFAADASLLKFYVINTHAASDAMLIVHRDKTMLVDCGDTNYGKLYVMPLLDQLGIDHIDYCYNTHPHDDHINGFLSLFDEVSVDTFYTCFPMSYCEEQINVMESAMKHGVKIEFVDNDSDISFGDLDIWLFQDPKYTTAQPAKANSASMIMHITFGDSTLMITGGAEKTTFTDIYTYKGDSIQSDIFIVPQHGRNRPTYEVFPFIDPEYAVITNFKNSKSSEIDSFLRSYHCSCVYSTKGTIEFVTDGKTWTVRQFSGD